jgi:type I restriction enzyme S subunit
MSVIGEEAKLDSMSVPDGWRATRLGEIGKIKTGPFGTLLKANEYSDDDGVPLISVREVGSGKLHIDDHTPLVPAGVVERLPEYILKAGDIVFGRKGAVDRSAIVSAAQAGCFLGSDGIRLRLNDGAHPPFYAAQFQSKAIQCWLLQNATGTTMASLNQEVLGRVPVVAPPIQEQRAIATALTDVDDLLSSLDDLLSKSHNLKRGAMQQLLTGTIRLPGFDNSKSPAKHGENDTLPEGWHVVRLGELGARVPNAIVGGPFGSDLVSKDYVSEGVPVIRGQNMGEKFVSGEFVYVSMEKAKRLSSNTAVSNDVIFTQRGTLGQVSIVPEGIYDRYVISQSQMKISLDRNRVDSEFIWQYFSEETQEAYVASNAIQTGVPHLNLKILRDFTVKLPPIREQKAISAVLCGIDAQIAELNALIRKVRDVRQGMMQQLLTGRIRLA